MSGPKRVYIVCSYSPSYYKLLEYIRKRFPEGEIHGVFPRGYEVSETERKYLDKEVFTESRSLSPPSGWLGLWKLSRELRREPVDHLGFQYESITLRLFGIACRPEECIAWLGNGQLLELPMSVSATLSDLWRHRIRGYRAVLTAWFHAYILGWKSEPPER